MKELARFSKSMREKYPNINSFKEHVSMKLKKRKELLVKKSEFPESKGYAAILFSLCYDPDSIKSNLDDIYILVLQRSKTLKHNPGDMAFPGGLYETGDTDLIETAYRESNEEIGMESKNLEFVAFMDEFISSSYYVVKTVVSWGIIKNNSSNSYQKYLHEKFSPKTEESVSVQAIPLSHFLDPKNYSSEPYRLKRPNNKEIRGYIRYFDINSFIHDKKIWGLTASMIRRFVDLVFPENLLPEEPKLF